MTKRKRIKRKKNQTEKSKRVSTPMSDQLSSPTKTTGNRAGQKNILNSQAPCVAKITHHERFVSTVYTSTSSSTIVIFFVF